MSAVALSYLPLLFIIPAVLNDKNATLKFPYVLVVIILFLYSVAFFAIYLEICSLISFFIEERQHSKFEKALKLIGAALTLCASVSIFFINDAPAFCFAFSGAIGVLLITELIYRLKNKIPFLTLQGKQTYIFMLIITLAVSALFIAFNKTENGKGKPDPEAPTLCIQIVR